jgi:2,4-dienoyl-CoA reductase-like NADH-dependent reductase (Old Yellow Enzyme family)
VSHHALFDPAEIGGLILRNRWVMSPMTRAFSPGGIPGPDVAAYYRRRAEGGAGLIVTEGTWIPHPSASNDANVPCFHGEALGGWSHVVHEVHEAGGRIIPQLWHVGLIEKPRVEGIYSEASSAGAHQLGPSGWVSGTGVLPRKLREPMRERDIEDIIAAYAQAAGSALRLGFDGLELHGAHGYLIDQFFWRLTNFRDDRFGGTTVDRSRFAAEVIRACRRQTHPRFPISLRISQWKVQDFDAKLADTPEELQELLAPLVDAGVDVFHCSQRRYWDPEFSKSSLNLAGWVRKLTGRATITVGSVGLGEDLSPDGIDRLTAMFDRDEFDMVAVGRAMLADPQWTVKMKTGDIQALRGFNRALLKCLA